MSDLFLALFPHTMWQCCLVHLTTLRGLMEKVLPDLLALGSAEHFLTDYGDEVCPEATPSVMRQSWAGS